MARNKTEDAGSRLVKTRKETFLDDLASTGSLKYKRYSGLPLRYAGGKSLAVGHIVEHIPENVKRVISPFFGGGSVEFACSRELDIDVMGFDVFDILVNYWQVQLHSPAVLATFLSEWSADKETYAHIKQKLKDHWENKNPIEYRPLLAAMYWYNHNLSYGPGFLGWMSSVYENQARYERLVEKVRNFSSPRTTVFKFSFEKVIRGHDRKFLYCDPPYMLDESSSLFKGIYPQRNFPIHHKDFDHELLRDLLASHKGKFLLSYNDSPKVREWYADYDIIPLEWQYTMGQGETRIGANREAGGRDHIKKSKELLIVKR